MPHRRWSAFFRIGILLLATIYGVGANNPSYRYVYQEYHQEPVVTQHQQHDHQRPCDHHHGQQQHDHHQQEEEEGARRGEHGGEKYDYDYDSYEGKSGCACLLYAESSLVSRNEDTSSRHSCDGPGLQRCGRYCESLYRDENARFRILQNACDTLGREIITPLYRRHQVCGGYGPYDDVLLLEDLCCRRGRPSDSC